MKTTTIKLCEQCHKQESILNTDLCNTCLTELVRDEKRRELINEYEGGYEE